MAHNSGDDFGDCVKAAIASSSGTPDSNKSINSFIVPNLQVNEDYNFRQAWSKADLDWKD